MVTKFWKGAFSSQQLSAERLARFQSEGVDGPSFPVSLESRAAGSSTWNSAAAQLLAKHLTETLSGQSEVAVDPEMMPPKEILKRVQAKIRAVLRDSKKGANDKIGAKRLERWRARRQQVCSEQCTSAILIPPAEIR